MIIEIFEGIEVHSTAYWSTVNPILALNAVGYEMGNNKIKVGDGVTDWNNLLYSLVDDQAGPPDPPPDPPSAVVSNMSAYLTVNQVIPPSTWTKVMFDAKRPNFDPLDEYDIATARFTPATPGRYMATACVTIVQMLDLKSFEFAVMKNRTTGDLADEYAPVRLHAGRNDNMTGGVAKPFYLDGVDDYLEAFVYQNTGVSRNLLGHAGGLTSFEVIKVA